MLLRCANNGTAGEQDLGESSFLRISMHDDIFEKLESDCTEILVQE